MTDELGTRSLDPACLEEAIVALPDVRAARVVATTTGRITEVHVIAEGGKTPKQLVRDVQTISQARFGLQIDHRMVSVVTFADAPLSGGAPKATLASLSWSTEGTRSTCRVRLEAGGETAIGETSGPATESGRARLAAEATTQALQSLPGQDPLADVCDIRFLDAGGQRLAVAVVVLLHPDRSEDIVAGCAIAQGDQDEAVARAVLDAYNRREEG